MPTILVTGASGFIGRAFCAKMLANGWQVRGIVRSAAPLPEGVLGIPLSSIDATTDWTAALAGVDTVAHFAARVHVMNESASDPSAAFRETNVRGTQRLAEAASAAGVRRIIFMSTIGVHGNATHGSPLTENSPLQPHNAYSQSKLEAEKVLRDLAASRGLESTVIRAPLVYGPENPGNFLRLLRLVDLGWPLPLASVNNRRSFVYLGNIVDALALCASHQKAVGTYLVSDGDDLSTPQLLVKLSIFLGKRPRLFPFPPNILRLAGRCTGTRDSIEKMVDSLAIDSRKIRRELGWDAPFSNDTGLQATAAWYRGRTSGRQARH